MNFVDAQYQLEIDFEKMINLEFLFSMRIVPLNKMHLAIPLQGQFRPIMVISPFIKLFECHYVERYQRICMDKINASHIGFISHMGCSLHISALVRELQSQVKKNTVFVQLISQLKQIPTNQTYDIIMELFYQATF
ncbi:unnamed protein product [Paramecium octaurelia]|uniref:Uncharacterized protein n=1 Tax=Paramecium octaurelia TaxID=43137 RepID=A0A8S1UIJ4_PAROT|nr:unnamed protein product [Paramecium octaurelia]